MVVAQWGDPGNIFLSRSYVNAINKGAYFSYELSPNAIVDSNGDELSRGNADTMPYLADLTIQLRSLRGDADLYASLTEQSPTASNADYASRKGDGYDELVILPREGQDVFNAPIYFSVFGRSYVQYEVTFEYNFRPEYNALLDTARQLGEGVPVLESLPSEYDDKLYSYVPWWGGRENRTAVFLADVIANKVFFYSQWNEYPKHFATSRHDEDDTIAIYGSHDDTKQNGTFYIRLRPEFALADLLSTREYVYNMYAFSMAPASHQEQTAGFAYETLEIGKKVVGWVPAHDHDDHNR
jgi:hypothetical protein